MERQHTKRVIVNRKAYTQEDFEDTFQRISPEKKSIKTEVRRKLLKLAQICTFSATKKFLLGYIPIIETIRTYDGKKNVVGDIFAGLSVGMVHIPQSMGFALLAAVAPVFGLYSTFWQVLIYMVFGGCRHLSIGTMAVISLIIGTVVERETLLWRNLMDDIQNNSTVIRTVNMFLENGTFNESVSLTEGQVQEGLTPEDWYRASVASGVSLIAGFTMLAMGVFRFGILTTFMPDSFIGGFTTAAAFHIKATQLKSIFNIKVTRFGGVFNYPRSMIAIFQALPTTSIPDLIISIICLLILITKKKKVPTATLR